MTQNAYEHRAVITLNPHGGPAFATVEIQAGKVEGPGGSPRAWVVSYGPILTDVRTESPTVMAEAVLAAEAILTATGTGFGWTIAEPWISTDDGRMIAGLAYDESTSFLRKVAARQMRRGVGPTGALLADTPRCNEVGPDGVTACNLAYNHRFMDPTDRHEYVQPYAGGRTVMSWAHCSAPSCCHYAATGTLCTGHARAAGLYPTRTGPYIND